MRILDFFDRVSRHDEQKQIERRCTAQKPVDVASPIGSPPSSKTSR
jgi:hypothetical protein